MDKLLTDAYRRIRGCTPREFWQGAVLYLGISRDIAEQVWLDAHNAAPTAATDGEGT